jgi:hypothetical protein
LKPILGLLEKFKLKLSPNERGKLMEVDGVDGDISTHFPKKVKTVNVSKVS